MSTTAPLPVSPFRWEPGLVRALAAQTTVADAALLLVARRIPVFPCATGAKQPLTAHGFHDATFDVSQVNRWWRTWPEANIGLPTGTASGVDVVDVDVHTDASGFPKLAETTAQGLTDRWAWLVRTPSGGLHAYFLCHGAEQRSWQVPETHIDFRGDGGYVIAPPSRLAQSDGVSRAYEIIAIAQHSPAPVDAAALRTFLAPPRQTPQAPMPARGTRPDGLITYVAALPEGGRNRGLFWAACCMAEEGHQFHTTVSLLGEAAHVAGLPDREIENTIRSAYRRTTPTTPGPSRSLPRAVSL